MQRKLNIISLFAGAGGLEIAACSTGNVRKIVSTDANATFLETTRINLPKHFPNVKHEAIVADARSLRGEALIDELGVDADILMGGPPCDDFTQYGRRMGMRGEKGPIIFEYLRLVKETAPKCFVFENVPNLARQFRKTYDTFVQEAKELNYFVDWRILSAADFGAPTIRKRIIAVGWRIDQENASSRFSFPEPTHGDSEPITLFPKPRIPFTTVADVLRDLPDVSSTNDHRYSNHTKKNHKPATIAHIMTVPQGVKVDKSYRYRAPWEGLCRSLTAGVDHSTKSYIHPIYHREMTVREYARLHQFPDTWVFEGNSHNGIKQVANAVPVSLGIAVMRSIFNALLGQDRSKS